MKAYSVHYGDHPYHFTEHFPEGICDGKAQCWETKEEAERKIREMKSNDEKWRAALSVREMDIPDNSFSMMPSTLPPCYRFVWY